VETSEWPLTLDGRSDGSIEFKHQNISAVLIELGYPYIEGYKRRLNFQGLLADAVQARLVNNREIEPAVAASVNASATPADTEDVLGRLTSPPVSSEPVGAPGPAGQETTAVVRAGVNYLEREARNRSLGRMGEEFALAFERARLLAAGRERLARQVEHVAVTQGDGLGYDIRSFESDGGDRLVEVKTTRFGIETPFFVSRNEVAVSEARAEIYHVHRVFAFEKNPRLFILSGSLDRICNLTPVQYIARV
jgi:hypothetical protein